MVIEPNSGAPTCRALRLSTAGRDVLDVDDLHGLKPNQEHMKEL